MAKFRWHRGSLADSLSTYVDIGTFDELHELIVRDLSDFGTVPSKEDIRIKFYAYDDRIPDNCFIVTVEDYGVLGFVNEVPLGYETMHE